MKKNCFFIVPLIIIFFGALVALAQTTLVSLSEFDDVYIKASQKNLNNTAGALNNSELKDLSEARKNASGATINLSGTGQYSGEKLIDIYNKAKTGAGAQPSGTPSANVSVKTLTPYSFPVRYSSMCGVSTGESIRSGETKYYKVNLNDVEWQRKYTASWKSVFIERSHQMCLDIGKNALDWYNLACKNGQFDPSYLVNNGTCPADKPLASCPEYFALIWTGTDKQCQNPAPTNYAQECQTFKAQRIKDADDNLKAQEALYASGNYITKFGGLFIGCSPYTSGWGCEDFDISKLPKDSAGRPIFFANASDAPNGNMINDFAYKFSVGFNLVPVFENLAGKFAFENYSGTVLNSANPISAFWATISDNMDKFYLSKVSALGANEVGMMINNPTLLDRNFIIGFSCPYAVAK